MPEENQAQNLSPTTTGATRSAETARALIRKTKRATRRRFPTEDKIRIVIEGVRGEILRRRAEQKQRTIDQRLRYNLGRCNLKLKGELSPKV